MSCLIEIETKDEELDAELVRKVKNLPASAILMKVGPAKTTKRTLLYFLSHGSKVNAGLVANWLFENIRDRATKLCLDRTEVQIDKSEIEKSIIKRVEKKVYIPLPPIHQRLKSPWS